MIARPHCNESGNYIDLSCKGGGNPKLRRRWPPRLDPARLSLRIIAGLISGTYTRSRAKFWPVAGTPRLCNGTARTRLDAWLKSRHQDRACRH